MNGTVIKEILLILIGGLLFALGVNYFVIPNQLSEGGIIGITVVAYYLFAWSPGAVNFILNMVLLAIGYKYFDRRAMVYTIISIASTSLLLHFTEGVETTLTDDTLLAAIFAGLLVGAGLGVIFRAGGTNGGTTVLARMANQLWGWSIGKGILLIDLAVVASSSFIIGIEKAMFTLISVYIGSKAIDFIVEGLSEQMSVLIISNYPDQVLEQVTENMSRGVTVLEGRGGYTRLNKEVLYLVISKQEIVKLKNVVGEIDEHAYVTVHSVHEIVGKGYRAEKAKRRLRLRKS
ncbi:UPF0750 membrane protein YdeO [Lentibacillus sp. JNUCC-1]|uniref:YitT family protein n=1 Tax=Lentibacillus sp. JNUCC-1 TaxID=2654513 RepID=UPI0012E72B2F|nr:YitT family protein [Lentibacillus sp. JNUCC-1]MUV37631.1 UPF0750 membrane protein YdeO [Lentibacillus sp. JNUCC-1]